VLAEGGGHRVAATGCVTLSHAEVLGAGRGGHAHVQAEFSQFDCFEPVRDRRRRGAPLGPGVAMGAVAAGWVLARAELFLVRFGFAHRG
jgi:hypothetical protein